FNISMEAAPERFTARLTTRSAGALRFARSESSDYWITRSRRDVDTAPADHWTVYLQMHGRTVFAQDGDAITLDPGDIAILDGRPPSRADFSLGGSRAVATLPRQMLDHRAPWLRRRALHRIPAGAQFAEFARDHLLALTREDAPPDDGASLLLGDNLAN